MATSTFTLNRILHSIFKILQNVAHLKQKKRYFSINYDGRISTNKRKSLTLINGWKKIIAIIKI